MISICVVVAGGIAAVLPGPDVTVLWRHSVQKTQWIERYRAEPDALVLVEASIEGSGAGMDPPPEAKREGNVWRWHPQKRLREVTLTRSTFTADYTICAGGACRTLASIVGRPAIEGETVSLESCESQPTR